MATIHLSESDNQQHFEFAIGDTIQINLDETPTTGFKWEISELNKSAITLLSSEYRLYEGAGVGGGGKRTIELLVNKESSGQIRFENRQPWSGDVYKTFEISYTVK